MIEIFYGIILFLFMTFVFERIIVLFFLCLKIHDKEIECKKEIKPYLIPFKIIINSIKEIIKNYLELP